MEKKLRERWSIFVSFMRQHGLELLILGFLGTSMAIGIPALFSISRELGEISSKINDPTTGLANLMDPQTGIAKEIHTLETKVIEKLGGLETKWTGKLGGLETKWTGVIADRIHAAEKSLGEQIRQVGTQTAALEGAIDQNGKTLRQILTSLIEKKEP